MVVSQEMERPVDEEAEDFIAQRVPVPDFPRRYCLGRVRAGWPSGPGLTPGGLHGDDDVAEKALRMFWKSAPPHRKGQNVGRPSLCPVAAVELSHQVVINQEYAEVLTRTAQKF